MTKLTEEQIDLNQAFLEDFLLKENLPVVISVNNKNSFLTQCADKVIYLNYLSPRVREAIETALRRVILECKQGASLDFAAVFRDYDKALKAENELLVQQHQKSSGARNKDESTLFSYLGKDKVVPPSYRLQTTDMLAILSPLQAYPAIFISDPIAEMSPNIKANIEAQFKDSNAKVAYVPVESGGHWTLEIFSRKEDGSIVQKQTYNPSDTSYACGDLVAKRIYMDAHQYYLEADAKLDLKTKSDCYFNDPSLIESTVRKQTIQLFKKISPVVEEASSKNNLSTESLASEIEETKSKAIKQPTKAESDLSCDKADPELKGVFNRWNALANEVIDDLQKYSGIDADVRRKKDWEAFFEEATTKIKINSWQPTLFKPKQDLDGRNKADNNNTTISSPPNLTST